MKLAFTLFKYFPYGGLQRDALRIAASCVQQGHQVTLYTASWQGDLPKNIKVEILTTKGLSNHRRYLSFSQSVQAALTLTPADLVMGFNKMPGLDIYYAGDLCFAAKAYEDRSLLYRLMPRCRQLLSLEQAVFSRKSKTKILLLSKMTQASFQQYYQTPTDRFSLLPPGISRRHIISENFSSQRQSVRKELSFADDENILLALGSDFRRKGLDRSIELLPVLSARLKTKLIVVGQDNPRPFRKLAKQYGVAERVLFLSGRDDVPAILQAADILLHPAYRENTGGVLLEALMAGLPVVATDICGYAPYISEAGMGEILTSPFDQRLYQQAVEHLLTVSRDEWRQRGKQFTESADICDLPTRVREIIESVEKEMQI